MASPSAQKTKTAFWTTFGVCFVVVFVAIQLLTRQFQLSISSSSLGVPIAAACYVFTFLVFQKRGVPIVNKSVQVFEKRKLEQAASRCELNMDRKSWRLLAVVFAGFLAFFGVLVVAFPPKNNDWSSMALMFGLFGFIAVMFAAMGWLRTSLVARVDEGGVTTVTGWSTRRFVPWSQIESCQQTQTHSVVMNSTGCMWDFRDVQGHTLIKVVPFDVAQTQQQEFSQVLGGYLSPSSQDTGAL